MNTIIIRLNIQKKDFNYIILKMGHNVASWFADIGTVHVGKLVFTFFTCKRNDFNSFCNPLSKCELTSTINVDINITML